MLILYKVLSLFSKNECFMCNGDIDNSNNFKINELNKINLNKRSIKNYKKLRFYLCEKCISKIIKNLNYSNNSKYCKKCGLPIKNQKKCWCYSKEYSFINNYSLIVSKDNIYNLFLKMKYSNKKFFVTLFINFILDMNFDNIINKFNFIDYIIVIPTSIKKIYLRKYSLCRILGKILKKRFQCKEKIVFLEKGNFQHHINRGREENFDKRFLHIRKKGLENKRILLIDDLFTTGKTLEYFSKELLKKNSVKSTTCFTLFRKDLHIT